MGAASLVGKELSEALADSPLAASDWCCWMRKKPRGEMTAAGDEAAFIQKMEADSFARMDFVFFAGDRGDDEEVLAGGAAGGCQHRRYDLCAGGGGRGPGAGAVGGVRRSRRGASARARRMPDLTTPAVVSAHPAAVMLLLVASRLQAKWRCGRCAATVFEPASEHGQAAMDELHQQTVSLLSFQTLPREQYDAQVAFNLLPSLGEAAKVKLRRPESGLREHYAALADGRLPELALQLIQAPVFHGYAASVLVELAGSRRRWRRWNWRRMGEHVDLVGARVGSAEQPERGGTGGLLVRISAGDSGRWATSRSGFGWRRII